LKVTIQKGLTDRIMMGGLPRNIMILGGTFAATLTLGMQNIWMFFVFVPAYFTLYALYKHDPYFLEILIQHLNDDDFLEG
jgi:type IV secretion system protein TrbD